MRILKIEDVEKESKRDSYFDVDPSSDFSLGFIMGWSWTEHKLKPLFIEFAEWLNMFVSENECGDPIYWNKDRYERKTTEELFELFMEQQTKK